MVLLQVKRGDEPQFLYSCSVKDSVDKVLDEIVAIFNGRLKVARLCSEVEMLADHGTTIPPEMQGLTDEQVKELKLVDHWSQKCAPAGFVENKDPVGRRCGMQPPQNLKDVLKKASETAKEIVHKKHVTLGVCVTQKEVTRALDELRGATKIVYPMGLPPHDPVRQELDNVEDLNGTYASQEVIDPGRAALWSCGKKFIPGNTLEEHLGKNDKSKVVVKLCKSSEGAPGREPIMNEEQRKQLMMHAYRKQEELKKLEQDDDNRYLDHEWADPGIMKRQFHGLENISWKPK